LADDERRTTVTDEFHIPVLKDEVIRYLQPSPGGIYVDGTIGGGGHAESIVEQLSSRGTLIGFDRDPDALHEAEQRLQKYRDNIVLVHDNFVAIRNRLSAMNISLVDGVVMDLGVSSHQLDTAERGFAFQSVGRLDMRMDRAQRLDALAVINTYEEPRLVGILREYGEEKNARKIARKIIEMRRQRTITTTADFVDIIKSVSSGRFFTKTLARVFQAIRIEVNNELVYLRDGLSAAIEILKPGARIVVLSYHSLEDRIVKELFRAESRRVIPSGSKFIPDRTVQPLITILTKKPVTASAGEMLLNPRARSVKLRAAERLAVQ
jgi:16S rRNA (cytosine1402-N4)-methyltransferase